MMKRIWGAAPSNRFLLVAESGIHDHLLVINLVHRRITQATVTFSLKANGVAE